MCLWMFFLWIDLRMWSPKYSSVVCRLNGCRAQHSHNFRRLRGASASWPNPLRPNAAPHGGSRWRAEGCGAFAFKRRRGGLQGQRWPGASKREAGPEIPPRLRKFSGLEILRKDLHFQYMFGQSVTFQTKMFEMGYSVLGSMITM